VICESCGAPDADARARGRVYSVVEERGETLVVGHRCTACGGEEFAHPAGQPCPDHPGSPLHPGFVQEKGTNLWWPACVIMTSVSADPEETLATCWPNARELPLGTAPEKHPSIRFYDPKGTYAGAVMRVYRSWILEVSWRQHTPGSFIVFCRREGVRLESELDDAEFLELRDVRREIDSALRINPDFVPDHFNYLQMGNALPSLHFHGIPRYEQRRPFLEEMLDHKRADTTWGMPPAWTTETIPTRTMRRLLPLMMSQLGPRREERSS